jgi:hypothetical protein
MTEIDETEHDGDRIVGLLSIGQYGLPAVFVKLDNEVGLSTTC